MLKHRYINQTKFENHLFVRYVTCSYISLHRKSLDVCYALIYERARNFLGPVDSGKF